MFFVERLGAYKMLPIEPTIIATEYLWAEIMTDRVVQRVARNRGDAERRAEQP